MGGGPFQLLRGLQGGGVGAGAADAVFLQLLDEGSLGEPGGRLGKVLVGCQLGLYKLIWERFIATQMANALLDTVSVDIAAGRLQLLGHLHGALGLEAQPPGGVLLEGGGDEGRGRGAGPHRGV